MECIICFLSDEFQARLRNISQQRAEKFEDVILEYKRNFSIELENTDSVLQCPLHKNYSPETIQWVEQLEKSLRKITDIGQHFDLIREVYLKWINGSIEQSILALKDVIEKNGLWYPNNKPDKKIFFRGRHSKEYLTTEDLYHIPYNKRYLISNQRYSLTGQPIIYLGLSVIDVFAELKLPNDSDFFDINFSSYILRDDLSLKIFDFTSDFEAIISGFNNNPVSIKFYPAITEQQITQMFYKFILISLCSFKRRIESEKWSFCEEYVLPQLITEISKDKGYEGILFYSTRISESWVQSFDTNYISRHKENLALFTKYNNKNNFDDTVINKFEISKPIKFRDRIENIDDLELDKLKKQIDLIEAKNNKMSTLSIIFNLDELNAINFEKLMVRNFSDRTFIKYKDHPAGQMHNYLLYQVLLTLRNKMI